MLRLDRVIKPWREADALNAQINLFGFWNENVFLTKSGDLGMVLRVSGIDYESLDNSEQDYAVKRLESALKGFGAGFHVYQYLFKSSRPNIPFATYDDSIIDAAIDQRREFFRSKRDRLYQIEIFYVILLEGTRSMPGLLATLGKVTSDPQGAVQELKARFSSNATKRLLRSEIDADLVKLTQRVENFSRQLADKTVDSYAAFMKASADDVVNKALEYVFSKDKEFQQFLQSSAEMKAPQPLRIKGSANGNGKGKRGRKASVTSAN